jgi:hypothetical protein
MDYTVHTVLQQASSVPVTSHIERARCDLLGMPTTYYPTTYVKLRLSCTVRIDNAKVVGRSR